MATPHNPDPRLQTLKEATRWLIFLKVLVSLVHSL